MKSARFGVCLPCLLAVVVWSTVTRTAGADTTLRWKFAAGQRLDYVLSQKTAMIMDMAGKKVETSYTQTMDMTWDVKGLDKDGNADMVQTIDRIRFEMMAQGGNNLHIDTADAQDAPGTPELLTKLFRSMAGSPFAIKITQRGEIKDFTVPPKLLEAFKNAGPAGAMFGSEESLKNLCSQSMLVFPEGAIAPGKSWNGVRKLPMPFGAMVMNMTYTLEGAAGAIENIGIDVKVEIEPKEGSPAEIKLTAQEMKGHYRFDNAAGKLNSSDAVQKMSMTVTVNGQQIEQQIESTVKMDLKKGADSK